MNQGQLNTIRKIADEMNLLDGDYQIVVNKTIAGKDYKEIKAFFLTYEKAIGWKKYYKNSKIEKM